MIGNCNSSKLFYCSDSSLGVHKPYKQCSSAKTFLTVATFLYLCWLSECNNTVEIVGNDTVNGARAQPSSSSDSILSTHLNSTKEYNSDYYDYYDDNNSTGSGSWQKHDNTKLAQVVIYLSVIFISLGGILIKYFVTHYETSQIKAQEQLSYHRLHNQIA